MPSSAGIVLIDTHAHIDYPDYDIDRDDVILRAAQQGVRSIINIGSSLKGSVSSVELANRYPDVYAVVGCHPHDAKDFGPEDLAKIKSLAACAKVVAIGEIGLDYYRNLSPADVQQGLFVSFLRLARELDLPAVIHTRQAEEDTIRILKQEKFSAAIVHCFSGGREFLTECLDLGLYISFTCNITYKKSQGLRELVKLVPMDRFCLETDAPYLSPEGFRGKRNEPGFVRLLAQAIADLRGIKLEDVALATTQNANRFFSINV